MRIEHSHTLSKEEIKKRGDALADKLVTLPLPSQVSIGTISRTWHDDTMDFSFRVSQGFFGVDIRGQLLVSDADVVMDINVPPLVFSFIDKDRVEGALQQKMAEVLS